MLRPDLASEPWLFSAPSKGHTLNYVTSIVIITWLTLFICFQASLSVCVYQGKCAMQGVAAGCSCTTTSSQQLYIPKGMEIVVADMAARRQH